MPTCLRLDPPNKKPCATLVRLVGHTTNTDFFPVLGWDTPRSAVLVGTRIWSDVSWFRWQSVKAIWHVVPLKNNLCHTLPVGGTNDKYRLPPSRQTWQFRTDTSTCYTNIIILYICSDYSIHLLNLHSLLPCLLSGS